MLNRYPTGLAQGCDAQCWHDAMQALAQEVTGCEELLLCAAGHCEKVGTVCPPQNGGTGAISTDTRTVTVS